MAAPMGNKFAQKWTEETALSKINEVLKYCKDNPNNYHLGYALIECDVYPDWWAYIANTYEDNEEVFRAIKKVEVLLEQRIINSTLSGDIKSAAMAIFYLKNKHGYKDKQEVDNTNRTVEPTQYVIVNDRNTNTSS